MKNTNRLLIGAACFVGVMPLAHSANVITQDNIIQGSECVGLDCSNGESFGFDTIRLKENNLRIHFDDTSSSASFSDNDWRITINDSANGGAEFFSIDDATAGRSIFKLMAGAPANSLYVKNNGDVGVGTSAPVLEMHVLDGDTPGIRLQQDNSAGWGTGTWDIAGNETNFFIRDVQNGSALPLRIQIGTPQNALYLRNNGNVGLGTGSPSQKLHIRSDDRPKIYLQDSSSTARSWQIGVSEDENDALVIANLDNPDAGIALEQDGTMIVKGDLAVEGTTYTLSSRSQKDVQAPVNAADVLAHLQKLPIYYWNYKKDGADNRHVGPMAEDFYEAFKLGDDPSHIASVDTAGVAFAAIKALNEKVEAQEKRIAKLEALIEKLTAE